jgi:hypothetical protein
MTGKKRKHAIFYKSGFHIDAQIVWQKRDQIALERRHLFNARTQREKLTGTAEDVGQRLRLARIKALRRP